MIVRRNVIIRGPATCPAICAKCAMFPGLKCRSGGFSCGFIGLWNVAVLDGENGGHQAETLSGRAVAPTVRQLGDQAMAAEFGNQPAGSSAAPLSLLRLQTAAHRLARRYPG